jgi:hypothetical protein
LGGGPTPRTTAKKRFFAFFDVTHHYSYLNASTGLSFEARQAG